MSQRYVDGVREYSVPATLRVADDETLFDAVYANAARDESAIAYRRRGADRRWRDVTAGAFAAEVTAVARGLIAAGVQPGDRVGAAVAHPLRVDAVRLRDPRRRRGHRADLRDVLGRTGPTGSCPTRGAIAVVVETAEHAATRGVGVRDAASASCRIWQIDPATASTGRSTGSSSSSAQLGAGGRRSGRSVVGRCAPTTWPRSSTPPAPPAAPRAASSPTATCCPRCESVDRRCSPSCSPRGGSTLLFLPLAHVFGKVIQCGALASTGTVIGAHRRRPEPGRATSGRSKPTFLLAVPRVFEKVYNSAKQRAHDDGKGKIFDAAAETAIAWSRARDTGGPGLGLRAASTRLRPARLHQAARGRRRPGGGRDLRRRPARRAARALLPRRRPPDLEGYGLTETSAGVTVNTLDRAARRHGRAAGPGTRRADRRRRRDPAVKGPIVFRGYWQQRGGHRARRVTDGWFHTGDIGELDDDGFLTITGRKKELIVTAGGKNVAPAVLEDRLRAHPLVSQCMVVGDQQPFIAALVTIDAEALPAWLERAGKPAGTAGRRPRRRRRPARRDRGRGRRREQGGVAGRADPRVPHPRRWTSPRRAAR